MAQGVIVVIARIEHGQIQFMIDDVLRVCSKVPGRIQAGTTASQGLAYFNFPFVKRPLDDHG